MSSELPPLLFTTVERSKDVVEKRFSRFYSSKCFVVQLSVELAMDFFDECTHKAEISYTTRMSIILVCCYNAQIVNLLYLVERGVNENGSSVLVSVKCPIKLLSA